jgi:hypothetical protein
MSKNLKIGDKVSTFLNWGNKNTHSVPCQIIGIPNHETRLYKLQSYQFMGGYVYRASDEFSINKK